VVEKPNEKKPFEREQSGQNTPNLRLNITIFKNSTHDSVVVKKS